MPEAAAQDRRARGWPGAAGEAGRPAMPAAASRATPLLRAELRLREPAPRRPARPQAAEGPPPRRARRRSRPRSMCGRPPRASAPVAEEAAAELDARLQG